jgi:Peptidase family M50
MSAFEPLLFILFAVPMVYISVLIHELGHALFGRAAGFVVTSLGVGTGRPLCVIPVGGTRIYLSLAGRLAGLTFAFSPQMYPTRWRLVAFTAGGIIANGITAAVSLALWRWLAWGQTFWLTTAVVNGLLGLTSLIPFNVKIAGAPARTDGASILLAIRWGTIGMPGPLIIQSLAALRGLWLSIGDTQMLRVYLWAAAEAWSQLDEPNRATALCTEADALPECPLTSVRSLGSFVRAGVELKEGHHEDAARWLDSAEADYRATGNTNGLFLVSLYRANARAIQGDAPGGATDLEDLQGDRLAKSHPELFVAVVVIRLTAAIAGSDLAAVERLLSEYEAVNRAHRSASLDFQVYKSVARFHIGRGDPLSAEPAYRRVLASISELAGMWADPTERSSFLEGRSALLAEARQCAETVGKSEEVERLIATILEPPPSAAEAAIERDRRLRRLAVRVMLGNVVGIVATMPVAVILPRAAAAPFAALAFLLVFFTGAGALYRLFDVVVGRFIQRPRAYGGGVMLILACCPWWSAGIILMLTFFDSWL